VGGVLMEGGMNETLERLDEQAGGEQPEDTREWRFGLQVRVADFLSGFTVAGILEGFTPGEVTVSLPERMSEQREVRVHLNSFVFDGETLYCQLKDGRYEAHITIDDVEETGLRSARRFPVRLPARMFPPHGSPVDIAIVDISGDGLGIELAVPVEVGQPIAIANGSAFVFAVVAHCRPVAEGVFRAGVEMQHVFERCAEVPVAESRSGLLGRVFGKR
jgi:hypothetical protein